MSSDLILVIVVVTALAFDFTNGFHDTANVVATSISTRALPPRVAVLLAAMLNFVGAFISLEVAATVAKGIVDAGRDHADDRLRRPDRRDQLEPDHLVLRPAVELVARADRRRGRRDPGGGAAPTRSIGDGLVARCSIPALIAPVLAFVVAGLGDPDRLPDRRAAAPRAGQPRLPARSDRVGRPAGARARHQRRAEDDGRDHAGADRQRQPLRRTTSTSRPGW